MDAKFYYTRFKNKDGKMRHVFIGKDNTDAGIVYNDHAFRLVRSWIRYEMKNN